MRETLDGLQGGLQIRGRLITNLRYADDIVLFGSRTTEVGGSPGLSQPQIQPTHQRRQGNVIASDGIACRILIQNEQLEEVDTFPYLQD